MGFTQNNLQIVCDVTFGVDEVDGRRRSHGMALIGSGSSDYLNGATEKKK